MEAAEIRATPKPTDAQQPLQPQSGKREPYGEHRCDGHSNSAQWPEQHVRVQLCEGLREVAKPPSR
jgi:hypothetical protein